MKQLHSTRLLNLIVIIGFQILLLAACSDQTKENLLRAASYEELKNEIGHRETSEPLQFLSVESELDQHYYSWYSSEPARLQFTIHNHAFATTFKDVQLLITFFSKTGSELSRDSTLIYEFFEPNSSTSFDKKVSVPEHTDSHTLQIAKVSASQ